MLSRVLRTIADHQLVTRGDRLLLAVSGGPDSMALLAALWELAPRLGVTLEAATVDHGLRTGAAAIAERALVAERAAALGVPFHTLRVDVGGARAAAVGRERGGVQETARRLRLEALAELAAGRRLDRVALGHQADDQTETVLFRILRGTGLAGLAGIPYRRGPFIRPLLDVTRAELLAYLRRRCIPFANDPSNDDPRFARARLRRELLPLLRRENPRVDRALRELAAAARRRERAAPAPATAIAGAAAPAPRYVRGHTAARIEEVARAGQGTRHFDVAGGRVTVAYGQVTFRERSLRETDVRETGLCEPDIARASTPAREALTPGLLIPSPGRYRFAEAQAIEVDEASVGPSSSSNAASTAASNAASNRAGTADDGGAWFDGDRLRWPLSVRVRRPGDRMRPRGGRGSRKLSDLLIDAKIPRDERARLPVVVTVDGDVLYVPGLRPSEVAAPSARTRRWIRLALVNAPATAENLVTIG